MRTRPSTESDLDAIYTVHRDAFGPVEGPEIADLVAGLLGDETAMPYLSLVAESAHGLSGHILFTAARIDSRSHVPVASILAPLGVTRESQRQGIGGLLVREGLELMADCGVELVFVLGHPSYYPRFGFRPAGVRGFRAPYPIPDENADAWMVKELKPGVMERFAGTVECASVLMHPAYWIE